MQTKPTTLYPAPPSVTASETFGRRALLRAAALAMPVATVPAAPALAQQPLALRLAHVAPGRSDYQLAAEDLAGRVAPDIALGILPGGTLGDLTQLWAQLRTGAIDLHVIDVGALVALREGRHFGVLLVPYLFRDQAHFDRFLASAVFAEMLAPVEQATGIRWAGYLGARSPRALSTTSRRVERPEDLRGLKVRTAEMPPVVEAFRRWGASPTPLRAPDLYNALQTGLVEGQDNGVVDTVASGYADLQKYYATLDYIFSGMGLWASPTAWTRMGPRQERVRAACAETATAMDAALAEKVRAAYATLAAKNVTVTRPDPAPFREALQPWVAETDGKAWPAGLYGRIAAL